MKEKRIYILSIFLMIISGIMLLLAFVYYDLSDKVKNYSYSNLEEYENVRDGIAFINKLPIHFNIVNKYFSDFNNLDQKEKEEILISYAIKNNYKIYNCDQSNSYSQSLCINKDDLDSKELMKIFNSKFNFKSGSIKTYIDGYGSATISFNDNSKFYKINLDSNKSGYVTYTKFSHYKKDKDKYVFYVYQGYYNSKCDDKLELFDFISGKAIYKGNCQENGNLSDISSKNIEKLQLYKYELKKDRNKDFYLAGYNPVNKYE